ETRTYVTTYCFSLLFIPLVALGAYRVADARGGGWYFIGKEPLSGFAKFWNQLLVVTALVLIGGAYWTAHTGSPEYRMARRLAEARSLAAEGKHAEALNAYYGVADGYTSHAKEARSEINAFFEKKLVGLPGDQAVMVLTAGAARVRQKKSAPRPQVVVAAGTALAGKLEKGSPAKALKVLEVIRPHHPKPAELAGRTESLLRAAAAANPEDVDLASRLGVLLMEKGDVAGCEKLLGPLADRLGTTEGARALGTAYSLRGEYEKSCALLKPYCRGRLDKLHDAERNLNQLYDRLANRAVSGLRNGAGGAGWYAVYDMKDKAGKQQMVDEYVSKKVENDPQFKRAQDELIRRASVVPVALDLGVVMLRMAQGVAGVKRRDLLAEAESIFKDIKGLAGETDEYRLFYGQVLYWLGRGAEGGKLYDKYLADKKRNTDSLLAVAHMLREVGEVTRARSLVEEAYAAEKDPVRKKAAASFRSVMSTGLDDKVKWLERSDLKRKENQASLAEAKGQKALAGGREKEAEGHFRKAVSLREGLTVGSTGLNNVALCYMGLFAATGDPKDYRKAAQMLERALAMRPSESVLLQNTADALSKWAFLDLAEKRIDFRALRASPDGSLLAFLYADEAGYRRLVGELEAHEGMKKGLSCYQKLVLLAPKNPNGYAELHELHALRRDAAGLGELKSRLAKASLDLESHVREFKEGFSGKGDARRREYIDGQIAKFRRVIKSLPADCSRETRAVAVSSLLRMELAGGTLLARKLNADEVVSRAERALADCPCAATRGDLISALIYRLSEQLRAKAPAYARMFERSRRGLASTYVLMLCLMKSPELRAHLTDSPDVKRLVELQEADLRAFPSFCSPWDWAFFTCFKPERAAEVKSAVLKNRSKMLSIETEAAISPMSMPDQVNLYWLRKLRGEEKAAEEGLRKAARAGVPLPWKP
ncbi:MAG: hypothetical protein ACYTGB_14000, partial [Planctomycetota bacterium]